ncbi:hypothetical protein K474DRAFT_490668 [Panus rudis PR-1116 ss-1]|nr:hypothetical protein K474DRAFT_490668 [Panus rudis PR-1116 ss-1]
MTKTRPMCVRAIVVCYLGRGSDLGTVCSVYSFDSFDSLVRARLAQAASCSKYQWSSSATGLRRIYRTAHLGSLNVRYTYSWGSLSTSHGCHRHCRGLQTPNSKLELSRPQCQRMSVPYRTFLGTRCPRMSLHQLLLSVSCFADITIIDKGVTFACSRAPIVLVAVS